MPISMSPTSRYVTQSSTYDQLLIGGELTNKKLRGYILAGWYGTASQLRMQRAMESKKQRQNRAKGSPRVSQRKHLLWEYDL